MKGLHVVSWILVIIGGLNWLLVGVFNWNLVTKLLGSVSWLERAVYIIVGLATLVIIFTHKKSCKDCGPSNSAPAAM